MVHQIGDLVEIVEGGEEILERGEDGEAGEVG